MSADNSTGQLPPNSAEELSRLLELELIQKRATWQRTVARNKNLKTFSLLFLFLIIMGGLTASYFFFMQAKEDGNNARDRRSWNMVTGK